jgi:hypothetical protein
VTLSSNKFCSGTIEASRQQNRMAETPSGSNASVIEEQQQHQSQRSEQKSMEEQSSGPGLTWMSLLGALSADDTTKPSTANVKVSCMLDRNGGNIRKWMTEVVVAAINKDCTEAIQKPLPNTRANAAALQLITSSIPADWEPEGTAKHVAFEALTWVCNRFQGGHGPSTRGGTASCRRTEWRGTKTSNSL